ncbi:hypothetical protein [Desulforamulus hydrothermalis]|uniref:Uncharacterized protein n=1 Tax=Desulforamulus hydrothermalis Lam5 = DSM 18033 TaxID=1121428 RepID=K8DZ81_9FIRM|nr:hypothetical protein [Desulforamulus hydrothermalis]CCO08230.1 conserved hypothetical protein [Desulforamulus hydrothermalis Lam5 = DSM 18033]SHH21925.1 hypothetical protein SAMN02745177_01850 [Desulforamulus hydrothermalis Lam5 = DSM 18033]
MAKVLKEGAAYNQRDVIDMLVEFSAFKDRVEKKFKEVAKELEGKPNEHDLWVSLYLISSDYADDQSSRRKAVVDPIQKIS